ncbi:MAG TPA: ankyrin repeat domain-containing protein [Parachlamydiaceae bacterium]|nr:ankyrin repeat domain-containing protein [Parachlamydiaceae bacterium]
MNLLPSDGSSQKPDYNQGSQSVSPITVKGQRRIAVTKASNIGIFSGKEKKRLELSGLDNTHKFAIALFDGKEAADKQKNITWVTVSSPEGPVQADVASIAKRFCFKDGLGFKDKADVIQSATDGNLEAKIQAVIDKYENDVGPVRELIQQIKNFKGNVNELKELIQEKFLREEVGFWDPKTSPLFHNFLEKLLLVEGNFGDTELHGFVAELIDGLSKIDANFNPDTTAPREKIWKDITLWGNGNDSPNVFVNCVAKDLKIYSDYKKSSAVRLQISLDEDPSNQYAIKTDGYVYHEKPEMTEKFLPYSKEGKTWVLLNINSLSDRSGISASELKSKANEVGYTGLKNLVEAKMSDLQIKMKYIQERDRTSPLQKNFKVAGLPQGSSIEDPLRHLTQYLTPQDIANLNKASPEAGKKIDPNRAKISEAQRYGYEGKNIEGANKFMEQFAEELVKDFNDFKVDMYIYNKELPEIFENLRLEKHSAKDPVPTDAAIQASIMDAFQKLSDDELLSVFLSGIPTTRGIKTKYEKMMKILIYERGNEAVRLLAASGKDSNILNYLLENGAKTDTFTSEGKSPLHLAVANRHVTSTTILLENGKADMQAKDAQGNTPLHLAVLSSDEKFVKLLLADRNIQGVDSKVPVLADDINVRDVDGNTPLHLALLSEESYIAHLLIKHGAKMDIKNKDGLTPWGILNKSLAEDVKGFLGNYKFFVKDGKHYIKEISEDNTGTESDISFKQPENYSELMDEFNNLGWEGLLSLFTSNNIVKYETLRQIFYEVRGSESLVLALENINEKGNEKRNLYVLTDLLSRGVKLKKSYQGKPLAHLAVANQSLDSLRILREHGVDINSTDIDGNTPLHLAFSTMQTEIIEGLLFSLYAKIRIKNNLGQIAFDVLNEDQKKQLLFSAAVSGNIGLIDLLIDYDVDFSTPDDKGNTPLHLAAINKHYGVVALILYKTAHVRELENNVGDSVKDIIEKQISSGEFDFLQARSVLRKLDIDHKKLLAKLNIDYKKLLAEKKLLEGGG